MRREIDVLLEPLRQAEAAAEPAYSPPNDIDARIEQKRAEMERTANEFRTSRRLIEGLLAASSTSANITLRDKLNALATDDAKQLALTIDKETAQARAQLNATKARIERDKVESDERSRVALANAQQAVDAERLQHDKDVQEAKSAKVKKALAFFTAKGYYQPYQANGATGLDKTTEAKPISLSKLRQINALDKTNSRSLQFLLDVISTGYDEARPAWPNFQSIANLSAKQTDDLKQIQEYLDRLGPVLVELGMLSP
jgi:hypothetical protein